MKSMTTGGKLLGQDDIDAVLNQAGLEGNYKENESERKKDVIAEREAGPGKRRSKPIEKKKDIDRIVDLLWSKADLKREEGVNVIWNASGVFPMTAGVKIAIQGVGYTSLGGLRENHLLVALDQEGEP